MLAFDLPDRQTREEFYQGLFEIGLLAIRSGARAIRFRPALDFPAAEVATAMDMLREQCRRMKARNSRRGEVLNEELLHEPAK